MITNPVNCMELSTIVVLHPSQLNNELYNNLKENQSDETNNNLNEENSYEDSTVKNKRVKIVGTVQSPLYISRSRG